MAAEDRQRLQVPLRLGSAWWWLLPPLEAAPCSPALSSPARWLQPPRNTSCWRWERFPAPSPGSGFFPAALFKCLKERVSGFGGLELCPAAPWCRWRSRQRVPPRSPGWPCHTAVPPVPCLLPRLLLSALPAASRLPGAASLQGPAWPSRGLACPWLRRGFSLARDQKPWAPLGAGAHPELPVLSGLAGSALNRAAGLVPALHRFSTFLRGAPVRKPVLPPDPWLWLPAFEDACSVFFLPLMTWLTC